MGIDNINEYIPIRDRIPLKMYNLPKQSDGFSDHALERYFKCHAQDDEIKRLSIEGHYDESVTEKIKNAPEEKRKELIEEYLKSTDIQAQKEAVQVMLYTFYKDTPLLIEKALDINNTEVQIMAADRIENLAVKEKMKSLIEKALSIDKIEVQNMAAGKISHVSSEEQLELRNKVEEIINKTFDIGNIEDCNVAAGMIRYVPEEKQPELSNKVKKIIDKTFDIGNIEDCNVAAGMIIYAPNEEKLELKNKVEEIIDNTFDIGNIEDCNVAAGMIRYAASREKQKSLIKKAISIDKIVAHKIVTEIMWFIPEKEIKSFTNKILKGHNIEAQKAVAEMIRHMPERKKLKLMKKLSPEAAEFLIRSPLYDDSKLTKQKLETENFEKTGSETTLVGGSLLGESIVRHIKPKAFLAWQKTYEDYETWQKAGFDYVPVEQIQSYTLDRNEGLVRVFSGVLDLSLKKWSEITSLFKKDLQEQKSKIINVLYSQNIEHGHTYHDGNFVLSFYRKEDGSVNFDKCPRLYAIDFDQAVSK